MSIALEEGCVVRAVVRTPSKMTQTHPDLDVRQGSVTDPLDFDELLKGVDAVVSMVGDVEVQKHTKINTTFVQNIVPAMRRQHVGHLLYQAGGLSKRPDQLINVAGSIARNTFARSFDGQHRDNEAVMNYLTDSADDIRWVVHRAGIGSDGPSKGTLHRAKRVPSIATFGDCAAYNYRLLQDSDAVHTCDLSRY